MSYPFIQRAMAMAGAQGPEQSGYLRRLEAFFQSLVPCLDRHQESVAAGLPERLAAPERAVYFSVSFPGDDGQIHTAPCCFIQYSTILGPARCALTFQPTPDVSDLKWKALTLALENSLAGLSMGGAAAGAAIAPAALSPRESMAFCQRFITALAPFLPVCAVLEGSVPRREQGYLRGQLNRLPRSSPPPLLADRREMDQAKGYGLCYFAQNALRKNGGPRLEGQAVAIGGHTGPAPWAGEKAFQLGAMVTAISGSSGCLYAPAGLPLALLRDIGRDPAHPLSSNADRAAGIDFRPGGALWDGNADVYLLCDPAHPLDEPGARAVAARGAAVIEGGENVSTPEAARLLRETGILYIPGIAAACGASILRTAAREPGKRLRTGMERLLDTIWEEALRAPRQDLTAAAHIAAFEPIARAMVEQGI